MNKQYLIEFEHDSNHVGHDGFGTLLITADSFERIKYFSVPKINSANGFTWNESFENARNFLNLTID